MINKVIKIRKFKKFDTETICTLIRDTYKKFNKNEGTKEAVKNYINHYDPKNIDIKELVKRFAGIPISFVAVDKDNIIGVIRGFENRIVNLFVNGKYHNNMIITIALLE